MFLTSEFYTHFGLTAEWHLLAQMGQTARVNSRIVVRWTLPRSVRRWRVQPNISDSQFRVHFWLTATMQWRKWIMYRAGNRYRNVGGACYASRGKRAESHAPTSFDGRGAQ